MAGNAPPRNNRSAPVTPQTAQDIAAIRETAMRIGRGAAGLVGMTGLLGAALTNRIAYEADKLIPSNLVFPRDLESYQLSMVFDFMEYKRRSIFSQPYMKPNGKIRLPIPKSLVDRYSMDWSEKAQDPTVGAAVENLLKQNPNVDPNSFIDQLKDIATTGLETAGGVGSTLVIKAAKAALEDINNTATSAIGVGAKAELSDILQPLGLAENPFLTVMFNKPNFKDYSFSWKLIPRDPEEAQRINKIIREFKRALLPDITDKTFGTLLNYPQIVQIGFFGSDNYLYRFKPAVIQEMSVNYAPAATPSFFKGSENVPTEIDLSLRLKEIEYWTKTDLARGYDPSTSV